MVDIVAVSRLVEEGYQCIQCGGGSRNRYHCDIPGGRGRCRRSADPGRRRKGIHLYLGRWRKEQGYTLSASRVVEEDGIENAAAASEWDEEEAVDIITVSRAEEEGAVVGIVWISRMEEGEGEEEGENPEAAYKTPMFGAKEEKA